MNCRALPFLLAAPFVALFVALFVAEARAADSLSVSVADASVTVRPTARGTLRLPGLEIETTIRGSCGDDSEPVSLSLSSADSVQLVGLDTIGDDGAWNTVFSVPARQVPPLVARGFCSSNDSDKQSGGQRSLLRKEAFLSVRVGLRCTDGETERLTTETALVDIDLVCEADPGANGQESSE